MSDESMSQGERAEEMVQLMNLAINACSQSEKIGSHSKGQVIKLLTRLRDEEVLRMLGCKYGQ